MTRSKTERPHFSASQLDSYCRCPEAYRQWYLEKNRIPPNVYMARGTGMHGGAAGNFRQKLETYRDLPAKEIIEIGVQEYEAATRDGITLTAEEADRGPSVVIAEVKDDLVAILDCHAKTQAPDYQPVMVEQCVRLSLPESPRDLLAVIDVATSDEVADFKTAKRSKSEQEVRSSIQLTIYAAAYHAIEGKPPATVALDTIVQTKTATKRQKLTDTRDAGDFLALANRINAIQHAIDAGSFPPALPGSWQCSDKYCGYYRTCPFVNGSRSQGD